MVQSLATKSAALFRRTIEITPLLLLEFVLSSGIVLTGSILPTLPGKVLKV
jgi:hypothetical protein